MARPTLLVLPGIPATPTLVQIDCAEMDLGKTIQFFVGDSVTERESVNIPVDIVGNAVLNYIVPGGPVRNALADLAECTAEFTDEGDILCRGETALGDYMGLRYL